MLIFETILALTCVFVLSATEVIYIFIAFGKWKAVPVYCLCHGIFMDIIRSGISTVSHAINVIYQ